MNIPAMKSRNFLMREISLCVCVRMCLVFVLNSYAPIVRVKVNNFVKCQSKNDNCFISIQIHVMNEVRK